MSSPRAPGRRAFLGTSLGATASLLLPRFARGEEVRAIGLVLPPPSPAATALEQGALLGIDDANALATLFGKRLRLEVETAAGPSQASARGGALARAGALALVGGGAGDVAQALRDVAVQQASVFLNASAPDDILRNERCARRMLHTGPSVSMAVDALAQWLAGRQRTRWAMVTADTPRSREIAAAARRAAPRHGIALVGADEPAPVTLLALDGPALAEAASRRQAERPGDDLAGIGWDDAQGLAPETPVGAWIAGWHPDLDQFSARELNGRFRRRFAGPMTEVSWAAWAAVKLVGEGLVRAQAGDPAGFLAFAESSPPFDGHKGHPLTFRRWDQQLRQPLYAMSRAASAASAAFALRGTVPARDLDSIGTTARESRCRLEP